LRQETTAKFKGLFVQPNSFLLQPGGFETINNAVLHYDGLVQKRRGLFNSYDFPSGTNGNLHFNYDGKSYVLSNGTVFRFDNTPVSATVNCVTASEKIAVYSPAHEQTSGDSVSMFSVNNSDDFVAAFPTRANAFSGIKKITCTYTTAALGGGSTLLVNLTDNRLLLSSGILIISSTGLVGVVNGTILPVSATGANSFEITVPLVGGTGTLTFTTVDQFTVPAFESAVAGVTSAALAAAYLSYRRQANLNEPLLTSLKYSRFLPSNQNAYFLTDNGPFKLDSRFSAVTRSGISPAVSLNVERIVGNPIGGFPPQTTVAYRCVYGRIDANNNLFLGAPSEAVQLTNIDAGLPYTGNAFNAATVILTVNGNLPVGTKIFVRTVSTPSNITPPLPANFSSLVVTAGVGVFSFTLPIGTTVSAVGSLTFDIATNSTVLLQSFIPHDTRVGDFVRFYRTPYAAIGLTPFPDYKQVLEIPIEFFFISRGYVLARDILTDDGIASNPLLYTNPNQETEAEANFRPPFCTDFTTYKGYTFYSNTIQPATTQLNLITTNGIINNDIFTVGAETYEFKSDSNNDFVGNERTLATFTTSGYVEVTKINHGLAPGYTIYLENGPGNILFREYAITSSTANTFRFGTGATGSGDIIFFGVATNSGNLMVKSYSVPTTTLGNALQNTAKRIVDAINYAARRDIVKYYAQYLTPIGGTPGLIGITNKLPSTPDFTVESPIPIIKNIFFPPLTVTSTTDKQPSAIYVSKLNEPEAVPLLQNIQVGSKNSPILRIHALRDSLLIIKLDGVFRLNGSSLTNFGTSILDGTVICRALNSSVVLNNSVYFLSNQGVVQCGDSAVRIVSRNIEPLFTNILSKDLSDNTFALGYESDRQYLLTTLRANSTLPDVTYVYNYMSDSWCTWSGTNALLTNGGLSFSDTLTTTGSTEKNKLFSERKNQNLLDYCDDSFSTQTLRSLVAPAETITGNNIVNVRSPFPHGLKTGDLVTFEKPSTIPAAFTSPSDVTGLRIVTVITPLRFTFVADSVATVTLIGKINFNKGINQTTCTTATLSGSNTLLITTPAAHGLLNGAIITIHSGSISSLAFVNYSGIRTINVLSPTTFSVQTTIGAASIATGSCVLSDSRVNKNLVTLKTWQSIPRIGDGIRFGNMLVKIIGVFESQAYLQSGQLGIYGLEILNDYTKLDTDLTELCKSYVTDLKFTPITESETGMLKYYSEFQASFRNAVACTQISVSFSNDSVFSTVVTDWDFKANSNRSIPIFYGWGAVGWGESPWGSDASILKQYYSGPASILRTLVPKETFVGTFIQPILKHSVVGESIDLQSVSLFVRPVSQRTSR